MINDLVKNFLKKIENKATFKAVSILAGGTILSQLITLIFLPILTRLYSPDNFSLLAVFIAITSIVSSIGNFRFEMAIPLPETKEEGFNLLFISIALCTIVSLLSLASLLSFKFLLPVLFFKHLIIEFIYLIPIAIWMTCTSLSLQYWLVRNKRFSIVSQSKISRSLSGSIIQVSLGLIGKLNIGLIYGNIIIHGAGVVRQFSNVFKNDRHLYRKVNINSLKDTFNNYKNFSMYSSMGTFVNNLGGQLPILVIATYAIGAEAGFLMLATRVISAPIGLIGNSVGQVYISNAANEHRKGRLGALTVANLIGLSKIGVGPIILLASIAPISFSIVFGNDWQRAGEIVRWMTPWIIMQYLTSPISTALQVLRKENIVFKVQSLGFILRLGMVAIAVLYAPQFIVEIYAISGFIFYSIFFFIITKFIGLTIYDLFMVAKKLIPSLLIWVILALVLVFLVKLINA